jgi:hypothetical protein
MRWRLLLVAPSLISAALAAQTLEVALAPFSPAADSSEVLKSYAVPLGVFRFSAAGGAVAINRIELTALGTGDFVTDMEPAQGVQLWLDDGNEHFNKVDTLLSLAPGNAPTIPITFHTPLVVADGTYADLWVIAVFAKHVHYEHSDRTYAVAIADSAHISTASMVQLSTPPPETNPFERRYRIHEGPPCDCCSLSIGAGSIGTRLPLAVFAGSLVVLRPRRKRGGP